jgi:hypothetical protein
MIYILFIFYGIILFLVAELFGRGKHIGRWWTFALLACTPVLPGIIALLSSPNANANPTKANKTTKAIGWLLFIFGILGIVPAIFAGPMGFSFPLMFCVSGAYLIHLGKGKIFNKSPKSYFIFQTTSEVFSLGSDFTISEQKLPKQKQPTISHETQIIHYNKLLKYFKRLLLILSLIGLQIFIFWYITELKHQCSSCGYDIYGGIVLFIFVASVPMFLYNVYRIMNSLFYSYSLVRVELVQISNKVLIWLNKVKK